MVPYEQIGGAAGVPPAGGGGSGAARELELSAGGDAARTVAAWLGLWRPAAGGGGSGAARDRSLHLRRVFFATSGLSPRRGQ